MFVAGLLEKTTITHLRLVNFHETSDAWSPLHADKTDQFIRVQSKTLKSLIFTSSFTGKLTENKIIGEMDIICPNLEMMWIISEGSQGWSFSTKRCLFHVNQRCAGLATSLAKYCPRLKWFNNMRVYGDFLSTNDEDGHVECDRYALCSRQCGLYRSPW